jgi:ribose 5-phosphate isomerase A
MEWLNKISEDIIPENISNKEEKMEVAKKVAEKVKDGDIIGFGSGSTSYLAAMEIAEKIEREGLNILAIPTSYEMKALCQDLKIPITSILAHKPDWGFDGADKVNKQNWIIKGRGAAMFKEKLNMVNAGITYILVDKSKVVEEFNSCELTIPIEVIPEATNSVKEALEDLGAQSAILRKAEKKDGPVITENENVILDTKFVEIYDGLEEDIKTIVGVVESGLFMDYNVEIIKPEENK